MLWFLLYLCVCFGGLLWTPKHTFVYRYALNSLVAWDNLINACVLMGDPDETISSRAYKGRINGKKHWTLLADFLDWVDPGHGEKSVEWDEGKDSVKDRNRK